MIKSLSILLPSYNNECVCFVKRLQEQAENIKDDDFKYEIIVADDGSTDKSIISRNSIINTIPCCRYIIREHNSGRAVIRNFLAQQAQYEYCLFLDSDRNINNNNFIQNYIGLTDISIACGGLHIPDDDSQYANNIRYCMERKYEKHNTAKERQTKPYNNFNTSNFIVKREIILNIPFDTRFRKYGYEDVFWGKQLKEQNIPILHIDNPILLDDLETNPEFISKMEEGMDTLYTFKEDLKGYSGVIRMSEKLERMKFKYTFHFIFNIFRETIKRNLIGNRPVIPLINIYKLGVFVNKDYRK